LDECFLAKVVSFCGKWSDITRRHMTVATFVQFLLTHDTHIQNQPKSFPSHKGPFGGADLSFNSPQPDTSWSSKSTDTGLVCRMGCLF